MRSVLTLLAALMGWSTAAAHVSLEEPQAQAGAAYKAILRVGHGCEGAATHTLSVRIPAGFRGAKPMPKAGWALTVRRATLAEPYEDHGRQVVDDVVEITSSATDRVHWLPDAHYDEFVLRGQAPQRPGTLWFKVLQRCERGELDWAEVPASGSSTQGLKAPAAPLEVRPPSRAGHVH
jgi:uncharacterized protein YcnI